MGERSWGTQIYLSKVILRLSVESRCTMSTYQKKWWTMFFLTKRQWILRLSQKSWGFVFNDPWICEWWLWFVSISTLEEKDDILIKLWRSTPLFLPVIPISSNSKLVPFTCKYLQLQPPSPPMYLKAFF